jgi:hypothetical protein
VGGQAVEEGEEPAGAVGGEGDRRDPGAGADRARPKIARTRRGWRAARARTSRYAARLGSAPGTKYSSIVTGASDGPVVGCGGG